MSTTQRLCRTLLIQFGRLLLCIGLLVSSFSALAVPSVRVELKGINDELRTNVELSLSIDQQREHPLLTDERIEQLHMRAEQEIHKALQPYGYYRVVIQKSLRKVGDESWLAQYDIQLGEPVIVRHVDVQLRGEGLDVPELRLLFTDFPLHRGDILNQVSYSRAKTAILQTTTELGFFDYRFIDHRIDVDLKASTATVTLVLDSGPRYRFGPVTLEQNVLDDAFLRRFLPFKEGAPYNVDKLITLQRRLSNSDYFNLVEVQPKSGEIVDYTVPVVVKLTPRKMNKYTFGIGYGTDTQARGKIGWIVPRVNRYGHRFDSELKASSISRSISANYRIPIGDPLTDQFIISSAIIETTTDTSYSQISNVGISLMETPGQWRRILSLKYQEERYTVGADSGHSILLMPGVNWSRVWADNLARVRSGLRFDLSMRGASDAIVSDTDFFQATAATKWITPFAGNNRLILRGKAGSTWSDKFDQLPASVRFFAGGSQSVRGYAYQSLGPTNALGVVEGGRHLLVGSVEIEHQIAKNWAVTLFYDRGNAIDNFDDPLKSGAGFGLRWKTPIGPLTFDVASAISLPDQPWRLHINIGPDL